MNDKPKEQNPLDLDAHFARLCRDEMTKALRYRLADILNRNADKLGTAVVNALRPWAEQDANIEALSEWLTPGGWKKIDGDKVEARLVTAARAVVKAEGFKDGLISFLWRKPKDPDPALLLFDVPRADRDAPDVRERIAKQAKPKPPVGLPPYGWTGPDKTTVLLGLDALRAGLQGFDWEGLSGCLTDKAGKNGDWLRLLAGAWIEERAGIEAERIKRAKRAVGIEIRALAETSDKQEWTRFPRALDIAAALGGPFSVKVDGDAYAMEPEMAGEAVGRALRPRGLDIVPADWLGNSAQLTLNLNPNTPPEALREYMMETAARTAHLAGLPNMCPKLLGLMFATAPMSGRAVKGTLGELAHRLYPDWKTRRQSKRDLQGLGAAFVAIKSLRLVEPLQDGIRHPYDLFIVDYDLSCKPDAKLGFMINPWLVERMKGGQGGGFFLLNMTRWLALGIQNPRLFPLALRLAAGWDKARVGGIYDPAHLRPIEGDRLAWECNTLPEGAAAYRAGKTDARGAEVALTTARANLEADLNRLQEAGLLGPWDKRKVYGEGFTVLPVPPADYAEACKRAVQAVKALPGHRQRLKR